MAEHTICQRFTVFSLFISILLSGCGYDRFGDMQPSDGKYLAANIGIGTLRTWYGNDGKIKHIDDDFVINGWVTAEDKSDNFYRSFIIQDATDAIEIRAGFYDLHTVFVRGRQIAIKIKNLDMSIYNGVFQLGRKQNEKLDYIAVRYIPGEYFLPQSNYRDVQPRETSITELTEAICGQLVHIADLQSVYTEPETWAGEKIFQDDNGNQISVFTSTYADFAGEEIPSGKLELTGIITKTSVRYVLKIRDLDDVKTDVNR